MKPIFLFAFLTLTLATSVGATLMHVDRENAGEAQKGVGSQSDLTQAQVAFLKATETTTDYMPPAPPR